MFRVGSLVKVDDRYAAAIVFYDRSKEDLHIPADMTPAIGHMSRGQKAIVLEVYVDPNGEWADGVRILCPFGIGWINGDMLREVR